MTLNNLTEPPLFHLRFDLRHAIRLFVLPQGLHPLRRVEVELFQAQLPPLQVFVERVLAEGLTVPMVDREACSTYPMSFVWKHRLEADRAVLLFRCRERGGSAGGARRC